MRNEQSPTGRVPPLDDDLRSAGGTPADGNVFVDSGFPAEKAAALLADADARMDSDIEGTVIEVLPALGLAHVRCADGTVVGVNRSTAGIDFDRLRPGDQLRLCVVEPFSRVARAAIQR